MRTSKDFPPLFLKFIKDSKSGKRLKKNGSRIQRRSVENYVYCQKLLDEFVRVKNFPLQIHLIKGNNKREHATLKRYYSNFYKQFTDFLYKHKNCHDNYVGQTIKQIRTLYGWLNFDQGIRTGEYYKSFYIRKEEIPIITLSVKQLQFLAFDQPFEQSLSVALQRTKDIFVFGCIVGLRFSDLVAIKQSNIETRDSINYLKMKSQKTGIATMVKLPEPAMKILLKYNGAVPLKKLNELKIKRSFLLPAISLAHFNKNVKKIAELAGWTEPFQTLRSKNGIGDCAKTSSTPIRFCDVISSHTMRRTSITTMLTSGMPDYVVRKISGHTSDSKAFFRYVNLAQSLMDTEIQKLHRHFEKEG